MTCTQQFEQITFSGVGELSKGGGGKEGSGRGGMAPRETGAPGMRCGAVVSRVRGCFSFA